MSNAFKWLGPEIEPSPGLFYFWCDRALYLGPDAVATVHAHHAVQVCIGLSGPARLGTGADAPCVNYEGAVIRSDQPHQTDVPIALIASFWLEPDTAEAQRLVPPGVDLSILPIERSKLGDVVPRLLDCWHGRYKVATGGSARGRSGADSSAETKSALRDRPARCTRT